MNIQGDTRQTHQHKLILYRYRCLYNVSLKSLVKFSACHTDFQKLWFIFWWIYSLFPKDRDFLAPFYQTWFGTILSKSLVIFCESQLGLCFDFNHKYQSKYVILWQAISVLESNRLSWYIDLSLILSKNYLRDKLINI